MIGLLYDKTFTMTSMGEGGLGGNNMGVAEDIEALRRNRPDEEATNL